MGRARDALAQGDYAAAELDVKSALQINSESAEARELYGRIYLFQQNADAAAGEFERSLAARESEETRLLLARSLVLSGNSAELVSDWERGAYTALEGKPDFEAMLSRALLAQAENDRAVRTLAAIDDEGNDTVDITRGIFALQIDGDKEKAKQLLQGVTERNATAAEAWSILGLIAVSEGDRESAEQYYEKAIAANAYRLMDRIQLADSRISLGKIEAANSVLSGLERQIPKYPEVNFLRGKLLFDAEKFEDALDKFNEVLSVNPRHAGALLLSASSNLRLNQLATAQRGFEEFLKLQPGNTQVRLQLAQTLLQFADAPGAERQAREVLQRDEGNPAALQIVAAALARQGMHQDSARIYAQLSALQPDSAGLLVAAGSQQIVAGEMDQGLEKLNAAVEREPGNTVAWRTLIAAQLMANDLEAAAGAAESYLRQAPDDPLAMLYLARVKLREKDLDGARKLFDRVLELEPGNPTASGGLAALAVLEQDLQAASKAFETALEYNPGDLLTSMNLALLQEQQGAMDAMVETLEAASAANPEAVAPRLALARYSLRAQEPEKAIARLVNVEQDNREDYRIHQVLAAAYLASGQIEAAQGSARRLLDTRKDDAGSLQLSARIEAAGGRASTALQQIERALALAPESLEIQKLRIQILGLNGELEQAASAIDALPDREQSNPQFALLRGRLALALDDPATARERFAAVFEREPSSAALALLSSARWQLGEREEAFSVLQEWLQDHPDDELIRGALASLRIQSDDEVGAIKDYRRLLQQQPDNPLALNNLAWLLRGEDPEQAFSYAEKALALAPDNADIMDTYAMVELERGEYESALDMNDRALRETTNRVPVQLNRARILLRMGRVMEAKQVLTELAQGPESSEREEALAMLSDF